MKIINSHISSHTMKNKVIVLKPFKEMKKVRVKTRMLTIKKKNNMSMRKKTTIRGVKMLKIRNCILGKKCQDKLNLSNISLER